MISPYKPISPAARWPLFWILVMVSLVVMLVLNLAGSNLVNDRAPYGIVSFELAGGVEKAGAILTSWNDSARVSAAFNLGLDYVFMLAYASSIGLGSLLAGETLAHRDWPLARLGSWLGWGLILAAICDAIENWALWQVLNSSPGPGMLDPRFPPLARWCAIIKFGLVFIGLCYVFYGGVVGLIHRLGNRQITS
jgi:hypothetical protein